MISNPRVRVILNAVKDLAVDSAAFIKSQRGMLRAAQDDIIAKGKATKSHSFVNLKIQSSQPTLMLRVGVIVYVAPSAHRAPRGALYFIASLELLFSEKSAATAFLRAASGRNTILWPLIIDEGTNSSDSIVSEG